MRTRLALSFPLAIPLAIPLAFALALAVALPALAHETETFTGWITDTHCGTKGASAKHTRDCVARCAAEHGAKIVFYNNADEKLYALDTPEKALEHVGHEVVLTGVFDGETILIQSIAAIATAGKAE